MYFRNPYALLRNLIPDPPLQVGTVSSVVDSTCLVTMPDGGQLKARGTADIGQRVFVRDGAIEGIAPNLSVEVIEI